MRVEDEYLDVLQNLEWAIVNEFRQDRSILDLDARDEVNALVRHYEADAVPRLGRGDEAPADQRGEVVRDRRPVAQLERRERHVRRVVAGELAQDRQEHGL